MKILDRVLLSVAVFGVGIGCALAVTHVDDVTRADADFDAPDGSYPYGVRFAGSLWRFNHNISVVTFPLITPIIVPGRIFENGYSSVFDDYTKIENLGDHLVFSGGHDTFAVYPSTSSNFTFFIDSDALLNSDGYIYEQSMRESLASWLVDNAELLEPPTDDIPDRGVSMSDVSTLFFYRLTDIVANPAVTDFAFLDLDFSSNTYVDFSRFNYVWPYSIDFYDTVNGFRATAIRLVAVRSDTENFDSVLKPFNIYSNRNMNVSTFGYLFDPAGSSSSAWSGGNVGFISFWGVYRTWTRTSSSYVFGLNPNEFKDFFTNELSGSSAYQWLERNRVFINAYMGYSQFVYGANVLDATYDNGYRDGYGDGDIAGYNRGYEEGRRVGYNQGAASVTDETTAVMNLFGAVISVPIGVLNGLSPLAIWNTPIIAIIVTFMFMGILFMILKKVL